MRTTVDIDAAMLERAKRQARVEGVTLGAIVDRALRQSLLAPGSRKGGAGFGLLTYGGGDGKTTDLSVEELARLRDADFV